jgi:hypothetical protein
LRRSLGYDAHNTWRTEKNAALIDFAEATWWPTRKSCRRRWRHPAAVTQRPGQEDGRDNYLGRSYSAHRIAGLS